MKIFVEVVNCWNYFLEKHCLRCLTGFIIHLSIFLSFFLSFFMCTSHLFCYIFIIKSHVKWVVFLLGKHILKWEFSLLLQAFVSDKEGILFAKMRSDIATTSYKLPILVDYKQRIDSFSWWTSVFYQKIDNCGLLCIEYWDPFLV